MKKLFVIFFLSLSMFLMNGCVKDPDNSLESEEETDKENDMDIKDNANIKTEVVTQEQEGTIIYENKEYSFTLEIPLWWEGMYEIEDGLWIDEKSKSVAFNFDKEGVSSNIFTIIILDEIIKEEDWEDPFLIYILEDRERTFVYLPSMEPTEELLKEENKEHFNNVSEMVEQVFDIVETFNSIK